MFSPDNAPEMSDAAPTADTPRPAATPFALTLQDKLAHLPTNPGCYIYKDKDGTIIYIGKAVNLKNRVRSYFQKSANHSPKTRRLVSNIVDMEWIVTDTELEAPDFRVQPDQEAQA